MSLAPHTLRVRRTTKAAKRVGRGNASQKGTTAGRGTKGQKARSGGRGGLKFKSLRKQLLKIPKKRGFRSPKPQAQTVTFRRLESVTTAGQVVTPQWLKSVGIVRRADQVVKIVATGALTKPVTIRGCVLSKTALAALEKVGGKIVA